MLSVYKRERKCWGNTVKKKKKKETSFNTEKLSTNWVVWAKNNYIAE